MFREWHGGQEFKKTALLVLQLRRKSDFYYDSTALLGCACIALILGWFLSTAYAHGLNYSIQEVNALLRLTNYVADQLENSSKKIRRQGAYSVLPCWNLWKGQWLFWVRRHLSSLDTLLTSPSLHLVLWTWKRGGGDGAHRFHSYIRIV